MSRASTGQVVVRERVGGTVYALRFRAYGRRQFVTLGTSGEGWNLERAEDRLAATVAAVAVGAWKPPRKPPQGPQSVSYSPGKGTELVYVIEARELDRFKVGVSIDPESRIAALQASSPAYLTLMRVFAVPEHVTPRQAERLLHDQLRAARLHGEWFDGREPLSARWLERLRSGEICLPKPEAA